MTWKLPFQKLLHRGVEEGTAPFPGFLHFILEHYCIILRVNQGGTLYNFDSLVLLDLELNPSVLDHWLTLYPLYECPYIYIYIYIYIYYQPQIDCFVLSQLLSVAVHVRYFKLGSKLDGLYVIQISQPKFSSFSVEPKEYTYIYIYIYQFDLYQENLNIHSWIVFLSWWNYYQLRFNWTK